MMFIHQTLIIFSIIYILLRYIRRRQMNHAPLVKGQVKSNKSYYVLSLIYHSIFYIGILFFYFGPIQKINLYLSLAGILLISWSWWQREVAMSFLGKYFSPHVEIRKNHELIQTGPYKRRRHPLLFCLLIESLGLAFLINSFFSLFLILLVLLPAILFRIYVEEKELIKKFDGDYLVYQKSTSALL